MIDQERVALLLAQPRRAYLLTRLLMREVKGCSHSEADCTCSQATQELIEILLKENKSAPREKTGTEKWKLARRSEYRRFQRVIRAVYGPRPSFSLFRSVSDLSPWFSVTLYPEPKDYAPRQMLGILAQSLDAIMVVADNAKALDKGRLLEVVGILTSIVEVALGEEEESD